ncbi:hypothetical protein K438DRAFT_281794 [Mycena galopus ATCC 62051]|nr:hypothetical protein K438DRAFT_281794 [Mycena galopus ATCC 62051]
MYSRVHCVVSTRPYNARTRLQICTSGGYNGLAGARWALGYGDGVSGECDKYGDGVSE